MKGQAGGRVGVLGESVKVQDQSQAPFHPQRPRRARQRGVWLDGEGVKQEKNMVRSEIFWTTDNYTD